MRPAGGTWRSGLLAWAAATLSWMAPCAAPAQDSAERAFTEAMQHFEADDYERALERFEAARRAGMATVAVDYNIGVCQYRAGYYDDAADTFMRIAADYPAMRALAEYNLGLARLRQDRPDEARAAFTNAKAGGDESLAALADAMLARMSLPAATESPSRARKPWYGYIDIALGHDDNVALLDDSTVSLGETTDSPFASFFGQVGMVTGLPGAPTVDANLYVVRYPDAQSFDQDVAAVAARWYLSRANWRFEVAPQLSYSTLDGDGYEQRVGLVLNASRSIYENHGLQFRVALEDVDDASSRFAFVSGSHQLYGVRYRFERERSRFDVTYELVLDDRASPEISATRNRLVAGFRQRMDDRWTVGAYVSYRDSRFDELEVTREENLFDTGVRLTRALGAQWQLSAEYRWSDNDSNVDGYDYTRNRIQLSIDRAF